MALRAQLKATFRAVSTQDRISVILVGVFFNLTECVPVYYEHFFCRTLIRPSLQTWLDFC